MTRSTLTRSALALTLALAAAGSSWGTPLRAQAQSPRSAAHSDAHTFALPSSLVGGHLRLTHTKRYPNGSVSYTFLADNPAGHNAVLGYMVYTSPRGTGVAAYNSALRSTFAEPMLDDAATVQPIGSGASWGYEEMAGDPTYAPDAVRCRTTMGGTTQHGHAALEVTVAMRAGGSASCYWAISFTLKVSAALLKRLP